MMIWLKIEPGRKFCVVYRSTIRLSSMLNTSRNRQKSNKIVVVREVRAVRADGHRAGIETLLGMVWSQTPEMDTGEHRGGSGRMGEDGK